MAEPSRGSSSGGSRLNDKALLARIWADFDVKYMKPFLTHARPTLLETLPVCCNPIARILTTTEQMTQVLENPLTDFDEMLAFALDVVDHI
jgi:sodium/hydrogen exchanger-like protein 6/7